ncbi:hypothetical protein PCE1_004876 [Barthelona sp. PCE]
MGSLFRKNVFKGHSIAIEFGKFRKTMGILPCNLFYSTPTDIDLESLDFANKTAIYGAKSEKSVLGRLSFLDRSCTSFSLSQHPQRTQYNSCLTYFDDITMGLVYCYLDRDLIILQPFNPDLKDSDYNILVNELKTPHFRDGRTIFYATVFCHENKLCHLELCCGEDGVTVQPLTRVRGELLDWMYGRSLVLGAGGVYLGEELIVDNEGAVIECHNVCAAGENTLVVSLPENAVFVRFDSDGRIETRIKIPSEGETHRLCPHHMREDHNFQLFQVSEGFNDFSIKCINWDTGVISNSVSVPSEGYFTSGNNIEFAFQKTEFEFAMDGELTFEDRKSRLKLSVEHDYGQDCTQIFEFDNFVCSVSTFPTSFHAKDEKITVTYDMAHFVSKADIRHLYFDVSECCKMVNECKFGE